MNAATYVTNMSNASSDRQKRFLVDFDQESSWSKYCFGKSSSQDSNGSTSTSNSSKSNSLDIKPLKPRNINTINLLQTPKKTCFPADQKRITPRKPLKPSKSANKSDPSFRGVTLHMKTNIKRSQNVMETQLVIQSYFTARKKRTPATGNEEPRRLPRGKARLVPTSLEMRFQQTKPVRGEKFSDEFKENSNQLATLKLKKECASCGTPKTPLWRDAEDGTPLCNACGIRYKKYRVRCARCWYIPKKEEKDSSRCTGCRSSFDHISVVGCSVFPDHY